MLKQAVFQNLSSEKFAFLTDFVNQEKPSSPREMASFLMGFAGKAKKSGIQFTQNETDFIIEHLKENMSPQERRRVDLLLQLMRSRNGKLT